MTTENQKKIKRLLLLAETAYDLEFVSTDLVMHFHYVREELGLAKLLMLIQEYVEEKASKTQNTTKVQ